LRSYTPVSFATAWFARRRKDIGPRKIVVYTSEQHGKYVDKILNFNGQNSKFKITLVKEEATMQDASLQVQLLE
jgi:hypothetical protein